MTNTVANRRARKAVHAAFIADVSGRPQITPRYFAGMHGEQAEPMTARELREWGGRVEVGDWTVKYSEPNSEWHLLVRSVVGTRTPEETWTYVGSFSLYREALRIAKVNARHAAGAP